MRKPIFTFFAFLFCIFFATCDQPDNTNDPNNPVDPKDPEKKIVSISITKQPRKTIYGLGDGFDPSGLEVTATYDDDTKVIVSNAILNPEIDTRTKGEKEVVIHYNRDINTKYKITVMSIGQMRIQPGTFLMGSPENEAERQIDETQHSVTLTAGFYMSENLITQELYHEVMGVNPSTYTGLNPLDPLITNANANRRPVEQVSWYDAIVFCNRLSMEDELSPAYRILGSTDPDDWPPIPISDDDSVWKLVDIVAGSKGYRLPTEAQWEYACRAGTTTRFWSGDENNSLKDKANVCDLSALRINSGWTILVDFDDKYANSSPVGIYQPNPWGIYDMHGNVAEWCWDRYKAEYGSAAQTDPVGPDSGDERIYRGGSWGSLIDWNRSAHRLHTSPADKVERWGFRVVRPL